MESAGYYPYLAVSEARKQGYDIVMTSDLTSDVPLLYIGGGYSRPGLLFEEKIPAVASAISNCGGFSSRLEIIAKLREYGVDVHQYGGCNRTHEFPGEKVSRKPSRSQYKSV